MANDPMFILLVGGYMTGKTVSACTFPKPMLYIDWDGNISSAKNAKDKNNKPIISDFDKIEIITLHKDQHIDLDFRTPIEKGGVSGSAPSFVKESLELIKEYNNIIREIKEGKRGPYKTLVIDSLTNMFRVWKENIMAANNIPALRLADYMTLDNVLFSRFIPSIKSLLNVIPFIICVDHEQMDKDEISGAIMEFPVGPSQNMGKNLGKEFHEVWRMKVEGDKYLWRTRKNGLFQCGSRLHLPDPIEANFKSLEGYIGK